MAQETRRRALKSLAMAAPAVWVTPMVDSVALPAHAQTSPDPPDPPDQPDPPDPPDPPCDVIEIEGVAIGHTGCTPTVYTFGLVDGCPQVLQTDVIQGDPGNLEQNQIAVTCIAISPPLVDCAVTCSVSISVIGFGPAAIFASAACAFTNCAFTDFFGAIGDLVIITDGVSYSVEPSIVGGMLQLRLERLG